MTENEILDAIRISAAQRGFHPFMGEAVRMQNLAAQQATQQPDTVALARAGYERERRGQDQIAAGMAMSTAIPQFHALAQQTHRQGLEQTQPWEIGEGVYMPGMGYVGDPFKKQDRLTKAVAAQAAAARDFGSAYGQEEERQRVEQERIRHGQREDERLKLQREQAALHARELQQRLAAGKLIAFKDANDNPMFYDVNKREVINPLQGLPGGAAAGGIGGKPGAETVRQLAGIDSVAPLLTQFETLLKDYDPRSFDAMNPTKRAQIDSVGAQLAINLKEAYALGALTGPDIGILEKSVANPAGVHATFYGREGIQKQIDSVRQNMAGRRKQMEQMYPRLQGVTSPYGPDAAPSAAPPAARPPLASFGR